MADGLPSKKQRELLVFYGDFIAGHGYAPSYREVMAALGYKSVSTVAKHVNGLIAHGLLVKRDNTARSVEVARGQGMPAQKPPAPSLSADGRTWLTALIAEKLTSQSIDEAAREEIIRTLNILGLDDVRVTVFGPEGDHTK